MKIRNLGVWLVRKHALPLGNVLADALAAQLHCVESENRTAFRENYRSHGSWIFIAATGIAVRYLDGLLDSKKTDPGVVVLDEAARFAIPLVGGHEGGANELAYRVARITGATPIVTTATEALKPLVVGIGCRKGVSVDQIDHAVRNALDDRTICEIREVATVDLKEHESGLRAWCDREAIPVRIVTREQIAARPWVSAESDWVRENLDLPGVCEPAALIASPRGKLIVQKSSLDGVSVAIVEDAPDFLP